MYALKRLLHESRTNGHSWPILSRFRSGMDLQCVVNAYGAACYIFGYTSKAEVEAFNEVLERAMRETEGILPQTKQQIYTMGLKLLRAGRVGMHEAAFRLCTFPFKLDSRDFVWIPAYVPDQRTWYINVRTWKEKPDPQEPVLLSLYRKRPQKGRVDIPCGDGGEVYSVPWSEMCLKTFATWIQNDPAMNTVPSGDHLRVRSRAAVISTPHYIIEDHEDYFYEQLLLYKPWYGEAEPLRGGRSPTNAFLAAYRDRSLKIPPSGRVDSHHTVEDVLNYISTLRFSRPAKGAPVQNIFDPGAQVAESSGDEAEAGRAATGVPVLSWIDFQSSKNRWFRWCARTTASTR